MLQDMWNASMVSGTQVSNKCSHHYLRDNSAWDELIQSYNPDWKLLSQKTNKQQNQTQYIDLTIKYSSWDRATLIMEVAKVLDGQEFSP